MSHELAFGIIGFAKTTTETNEIMAQVHLTMEDEIFKMMMVIARCLNDPDIKQAKDRKQ